MNLYLDMNQNDFPEHIQRLLDYKQQGYLFHGSSNPDLTILEPRQSSDVDSSHTWNIDEAVFATDVVASTIPFSIIDWDRDKLSGTWTMDWKNGKAIAIIPRSFEEVICKNVGYIYVLPGESFTEKSGNQFKSKTAVKPVDKIEIRLEDYEVLGGILQWQENE